MNKILIIGTYIIDVLIKGYPETHLNPDNICFSSQCHMSTGGNACNVAVNLAKLEMNVTALGEVANDSYGLVLIKEMEKLGVKTHLMQLNKTCGTGVSVIFVDKYGEKSILQYVGANGAFELSSGIMDEVLEFDTVVISGIGLINKFEEKFIEFTKLLKTKGVTIVVDTSANVKSLIKYCDSKFLQYVDYFIPNEREAMELADKEDVETAAQYFAKMGCANVIIKLGERGCYVLNEKVSHYEKAPEVIVEDTTGAGDAFVAGFLYGLSRGYSIIQSAKCGNFVGANCVKKLGATSNIIVPDMEFTAK